MSKFLMSLAILAALPQLAPAAAPAKQTTPLTAQQLREAVSAALAREAQATGPERDAATRQLIDLLEQVGRHPSLSDRTDQQAKIRARLAKVRERIQREAAKSKTVGAAGGAGVRDYGPDLVDLITTTIAPDSWQVNGGEGVIVYFGPRRVLVVRQTGEVHGGLADVLGQLRRN